MSAAGMSPMLMNQKYVLNKVSLKKLFLILATPCSLQDFISPTSDRTWALSSESVESYL